MTETTKTRGQMAIKSRRLDAEWQALVRKAAERSGLGVGDFIVEACRARALAVLKGEPEEGIPSGIPPARQEDMRDLIREMLAELRQEQAAAVERLAQEQRDAVARLERQSRKGLWRR